MQHHEQPVVTLRLLVRAGAAQDPDGKQGVAVLAAALLDQGAGTRSAAAIADAIDTIGGGLTTGAGSDLSVADVLVMKDSLAFGFDLLADVVRRPAFDQAELDRQRQQALSGLKVNYEDPDYVASLVFDRLVYGFHPYGLPNTGTPESLAGSPSTTCARSTRPGSSPTTPSSASSATSRAPRRWPPPRRRLATGSRRSCRNRITPRRRRRRAAWS